MNPDQPAARWPLHPEPGELESLSSWLGRLAGLYGLSARELITGSLGLPAPAVPRDLDIIPPVPILAALTQRTGIGQDRLRTMCLAGWQPWLLDTFPIRKFEAQATFGNYVRANPVLLAPGDAGEHDASHPWPWRGPWVPRSWMTRACPACAAEPDRGTALIWMLPLTVSCAEHGCVLAGSQDIALAIMEGGRPPDPVPAAGHRAALDRCTHQALTTGLVTLPGRIVHAGVWFRLLRSLLDEVSLAPSTLSKHGRATIEQVWEAAGRPRRGGLNVWRPYEHMPWHQQEAMLDAAATAVSLAAAGRITPRGALGTALQVPEPRQVHDGDPSGAVQPSAWLKLMVELENVVRLARTNRETARQLLVLLTVRGGIMDRFDRVCQDLAAAGIPPAFLSDAGEPGPPSVRQRPACHERDNGLLSGTLARRGPGRSGGLIRRDPRDSRTLSGTSPAARRRRHGRAADGHGRDRDPGRRRHPR